MIDAMVICSYAPFHIVYTTPKGKCDGLVEESPQRLDLVGDRFSKVITEAFGLGRKKRGKFSPRCIKVLHNWAPLKDHLKTEGSEYLSAKAQLC